MADSRTGKVVQAEVTPIKKVVNGPSRTVAYIGLLCSVLTSAIAGILFWAMCMIVNGCSWQMGTYDLVCFIAFCGALAVIVLTPVYVLVRFIIATRQPR